MFHVKHRSNLNLAGRAFDVCLAALAHGEDVVFVLTRALTAGLLDKRSFLAIRAGFLVDHQVDLFSGVCYRKDHLICNAPLMNFSIERVGIFFRISTTTSTSPILVPARFALYRISKSNAKLSSFQAGSTLRLNNLIPV